MTDEELIARWDGYAESMGSVMGEAEHMAQQMRNRIEALVKERDQWIEHTKNAVWADSEELELANARAERLEAALLEIAGGAHFADDPWGIARAALKGEDHE